MSAAVEIADLHDALDHLAEIAPLVRAGGFTLYLQREREHLHTVEDGRADLGRIGPWQAIASMHEDIDRMVAKDMRPGIIARRRAEVHAVECELHRLQTEADRHELEAAAARDRERAAMERIGMLADVLRMLGVSPSKFLQMPAGRNGSVFTEAVQLLRELVPMAQASGIAMPCDTADRMALIYQVLLTIKWQRKLKPGAQTTAKKFLDAIKATRQAQGQASQQAQG